MKFTSSTAWEVSFAARLSTTKRDSAELESSAEVEPAKPESPLQLKLCVALLKGEKFDLVVQKATELGVTQDRAADHSLRGHPPARRNGCGEARRTLAAYRVGSGEAIGKSGCAGSQFAGDIRVGFGGHKDDELCVMFSERGGESLKRVARASAESRLRLWLVLKVAGPTKKSNRPARRSSHRHTRRAHPARRNGGHHRRRPTPTPLR